MEWFQFLTLIATMIGAVFAFYRMTQEKIGKMEEFHRADLNKMEEMHREDIQRHDEELKEMRQETKEEFSKVHTLWANLLEKICTIKKQIFEIKLDQSRKI